MKRKNIILLISLLFLASIGFSQTGNRYKIAQIENWSEFEKLTTLEIKSHTINERRYKRRDKRYKPDSLYLLTDLEERKKLLHKKIELKKRLNYKENRARYFVEYLEDSLIVDKTFSNPDTISTECRCELTSDTVQVKMGIWIFGGFFYNIYMNDEIFELVYVEDAHEIKPFKYKKTDTLFVEDLKLNIENSSLLLTNELKLEIGEQLNGKLKFTSPDYFVASNFRENSLENKLKKGVTKGEIYFTCKLREPLESPKKKE